MNNQFGRYYFSAREDKGFNVFETNQLGTPDSFVGYAPTEDGAREMCQCLHIEDLEKRLKVLQELNPSEFSALWNAKHLPHSGVHAGTARAPGQIGKQLLDNLIDHELLCENPARRGFYILTFTGTQVIGAPEA